MEQPTGRVAETTAATSANDATDRVSTNSPAASPIRHVAWSARILAATRAEETERTTSPPLVIDSLAASLAYPDRSSGAGGDDSAEYGGRRMWLHHTHFHFRRVKDSTDEAEVARLRAEADALNRDKAERPDTLIRCRYIDQLLAATMSAQGETAHFKQLVLLGAGLDTRAYRCGYLAGVRVYEVDRAEVLAYKQAVLQQCEARLMAASVEYIVGELSRAVEGREADVTDTDASVRNGGKKGKKREKSEEELDLTKARDRRALQVIQKRAKQQHADAQTAASQAADGVHLSTAISIDASSASTTASSAPAWSSALRASSTFDPTVPTVWIAEGVAMYLTPVQLSSLLRTAATLCAPSSLLCFDHVTAKLGRWHRLFSSALTRAECVRLVEASCGAKSGWRVGERRGREVRLGYEAGDGVAGIGWDELSYGR